MKYIIVKFWFGSASVVSADDGQFIEFDTKEEAHEYATEHLDTFSGYKVIDTDCAGE